MAKVFLITRPKYDKITTYLHDFSKGIVKTIKTTKHIHVTDLEGSEVTRSNVERSLIKENPGLVFFNGHGDRKRVAGHDDEVILDEENIRLTKDKIIYALSCDSLEDLGQIAVEGGTKAYIGYKARFMIVRDPSREGVPHKDKNALPFKRACFSLINALLSGIPADQAIEITKDEYRHSIKSYGTSKDIYGDTPLIRFALTWNLEFLDMYGDPKAVFN